MAATSTRSSRLVDRLIRWLNRYGTRRAQVTLDLKHIDFYTHAEFHVFRQAHMSLLENPWVVYVPGWELVADGQTSAAAINKAWELILLYTEMQQIKSVSE